MTPKDRNLVLTKSQAECLIALQHGKASKAEIAIMTKLDLLKTNDTLHVLKWLGLAEPSLCSPCQLTDRERFVALPPYGRCMQTSGCQPL